MGQKAKKLTNTWIENRYVKNNGVRATSQWVKIDGYYYYFNEDGIKVINQWVRDYYVKADGKMAEKEWIWDSAYQSWYYLKEGGAYARNEVLNDGSGFFKFYSNGKMYYDTASDGYYYKHNGRRAVKEWVMNAQTRKKEFYQADGKKATSGWVYDGQYWFYLTESGDIAISKWIGEYYVKADGKMAEKEWIWDDSYQSWYYLKEGGAYARNESLVLNGEVYRFHKNGKMYWNESDGTYFYAESGARQRSQWIMQPGSNKWMWVDEQGLIVKGRWITYRGSEYYLKSDGTMASDEWIGEWYVDSDGVYQAGKKKSDRREMGTKRKVVFLDPGHGGIDTGAVYYGLQEKDLNLQVYFKLKAKLQAAGYTVLTSRESDLDVDFKTERSVMVNNSKADLFISLHFNATGGGSGSAAQGIETYWYEYDAQYPSKINAAYDRDPERLRYSELLAKSVHNALLEESGAMNRGIRRDTFAVLRETAVPAILVEMGYMDNWSESQIIRTSAYQDKLVAGLMKGIKNYYSQL